MYSVSIRSIVLLVRSKTLGSGVLGQYSVRSFVGEIQDIRVRCTRSVVLLVRSKTLGSDVLGQYSVSSSVGGDPRLYGKAYSVSIWSDVL